MTRVRFCTFTVAECGEIWSVTRDGAFYGDYNVQAQAIASAQLGAQTVEQRGGAACVILQPNSRVIAH